MRTTSSPSSPSDGHGGITSYVVTYVAPEPPEQPSSTDAPGAPLGGITLSPDKSRAYQFSYDEATNKSYLTIVDTDSGDPLRDPIELQGNGQAAQRDTWRRRSRGAVHRRWGFTL